MASYTNSEKEHIAKKRAKIKVKIEKLEDKKYDASSDRKEKKLEKKISEQKALYVSYGEILRSPTSTNKSTEINVNVNFSKTHKTKNK